jgi:hypothetical protein
MSSGAFEVTLRKEEMHVTCTTPPSASSPGSALSRLKLDNCLSNVLTFRPPIGDIYVEQNHKKHRLIATT